MLLLPLQMPNSPLLGLKATLSIYSLGYALKIYTNAVGRNEAGGIIRVKRAKYRHFSPLKHYNKTVFLKLKQFNVIVT